MDSQSVKNTDSAEQKGYDAGKKVSGIKRHIAVDTQGLPHAIHVTTANVTDRAGALAMFDQRRDGLSLVQNVLVDGGYTGDPFAAGVQSLLGASVEVVKRNEMHTFVVLPKRWVVERSFAWLEKCRRLWKNCERKLNTSLQMVVLAFAALILKRLQTGSKNNFPKKASFIWEIPAEVRQFPMLIDSRVQKPLRLFSQAKILPLALFVFVALLIGCSGGEPESAFSRTEVISAGFTHQCALAEEGGLACWGDNFYGEVGDAVRPTSETLQWGW